MDTPLNPSKRYVPVTGVGMGGAALSYLMDGKPWYSYWQTPRMNRDPWVSFLKKIWVSPLRRVKWTVKATSQPVADFVDRTLKRFWNRSVPNIMRRYFDWGFAPGGVEYRVKRGRWLLDTVRAIQSPDARVMVYTRGQKSGDVAGFTTESTGPVLGRYAFWFSGNGEHGRHYDPPPIAWMYDAWLEKNERGGALNLRHLVARKHSVRPAVGKHPAGEQTWTDANGVVHTISNQQLMLSALELYESGANVAMESGYDEHGNPLWDLRPAEAGPDVKQPGDYVDALDIKMGEAVGLPAEVVRAAASGSGYSGRSVPEKAWLGGVDEYVGLLLEAFDRSPLRGLVHQNFGPRADYEIEPQSLVPADGPPAGGQPGNAPQPQPTAPKPPSDLPAGVNTGPTMGDPQGDPFELSAYASQPKQDTKTSHLRRTNAARFALLAMLRLRERGEAEGHPAKYAAAIRALAEAGGDPDAIRAVLDAQEEGSADRFDMAWNPYLSKRKTKGGGKGIQIGWVDDATGRVVYRKQKPGHRREKAQADAATADDLLGKIDAAEPAERAAHLRALADHLPALPLAKLREVRAKLGGTFGGQRTRAAGMVEALAEHFRLRAATDEQHDAPDMVDHRARVAEARDLRALPKTDPRADLDGLAADADTGEDLRDDAIVPPPPPPGSAPPARPDGTPVVTRVADVYTVPTAALKADPKRFQYKVTGIGSGGVTKELKGTQTWNPALGGTLLVWRDPQDGQDYVVNGHHRHELADRVGQETVNARYIEAATAEEARAQGALANIAEGRGTATDAAKFLRDTGGTVAHLKQAGVSLSGKVAADAVALTALSDKAFQAVADGTLGEPTAVAVARHLADPKLQDKLLAHIAARQEDGKDWTPAQVEVAAKKMAAAGKTTVSETNLFGTFEDEHSTFDQEVELEHHVGRVLGTEANDYGVLASRRRAEATAGAGNTLNTEANARLRDAAVSNADLFDRHRHLKGPVAEAIKTAAAKLAAAKTKKEKDRVKQEAVESVRAALGRVGTADEFRPPEPATPDAGAVGAGDGRGADADPTPGAGTGADHAGEPEPGAGPVAPPVATNVPEDPANVPPSVPPATIETPEPGSPPAPEAAPESGAGGPESGPPSKFDVVARHARARHEDELAAMKPNTQQYVGGHLVTRQVNGGYHLNKGKRSVVTGDAATVAAAIREGWGRQKWQGARVAAALERADKHQDAIPMIDGARYDREQKAMDAVPDGASAVSTAAGTYGRVGTITRGEDGGRRLVFDDGPAEEHSLDWEPLEPEFSWRGGGEMRPPKPVRAARKGLFDDMGTGEKAEADDAPPEGETEPGPHTPPDGPEPPEIPADATPREAAGLHATAAESAYAHARTSAVPNLGEDLKGSARHRANEWRGLAEAEADGTAEELVTRDNLLRAEPPGLTASIRPHNALPHLAAHLALSAFPPTPGKIDSYAKGGPGRRTAAELRAQYLDAYRAIKAEAEKAAAEEVHPDQVRRRLLALTTATIRAIRGTPADADRFTASYTSADPYNPVANELVKLSKALESSYRPKATTVQGRVADFAARTAKAYPTPTPEALGHIQRHVQDVIEGDSFNKTFGTVGGGPKRFDPAEAYVATAERKGGRVIDTGTVEAAGRHLTGAVGMRGVQYGNYVTDDERQHHLAKSAEAFADLADVLGVPDAAISLGGRLGLAVGARGKGGARAHYEPDTQVINLTRAKGVGSLAHEWGHALDHMLQEFRTAGDVFHSGAAGLYRRTASPTLAAMQAVRRAWDDSGFAARLREEVRARVKKGELPKNAMEYWASPEEMFARTFERHVQQALHDAGRENTYLTGLHKAGHPLWPNAEETKAIAPAVEALFAAIREAHFGGGTAAASPSPAGAVPSAPMTPPTPPTPPAPEPAPQPAAPEVPPWTRPPDLRKVAAGMAPAGSHPAPPPEAFPAQYEYAARTGNWGALRAMGDPHPEGGRPGGYLPTRDAIRALIGEKFGDAAKEAARKIPTSQRMLDRLIELSGGPAASG